jgi:TonB family protein
LGEPVFAFSLFALAVVSADSAPKKPEPTGSLQGLISSDDYPAEALARNEEGSVWFILQVNESGGIADCVIEQSSGSPSLDAQTCRLMWLRAKFKPARDKNGKPIPSQTEAKVTWRIEGAPDPSEAWEKHGIINVVQGKPKTCRVEVRGALDEKSRDVVPCPADIPAIPKQLLAMPNASGTYVVEQQFTLGAEPKTAMTGQDRLVGRQVARLEIDAAGSLSSCQIIESAGELGLGSPGVCQTVSRRYVPKKSAAGTNGAFTAYYALAEYVQSSAAH